MVVDVVVVAITLKNEKNNRFFLKFIKLRSSQKLAEDLTWFFSF